MLLSIQILVFFSSSVSSSFHFIIFVIPLFSFIKVNGIVEAHTQHVSFFFKTFNKRTVYWRHTYNLLNYRFHLKDIVFMCALCSRGTSFYFFFRFLSFFDSNSCTNQHIWIIQYEKK